ncbi:hypothetical protein HYC85_009631 [Camellia sinensis]|uniref:Uncharacterized protein n=1 Tax=Camellia sinensis TaxID=4442 RepID=A0A7J7HGX2_CAMSI|nr:hypothetical protein HYC85_009631 [Camellia sinensis]
MVEPFYLGYTFLTELPYLGPLPFEPSSVSPKDNPRIHSIAKALTFTNSHQETEYVLDSCYTYDNGPNNPATTFIFGPLYLVAKVYQLSPIERPLPLYNLENMSKELVL